MVTEAGVPVCKLPAEILSAIFDLLPASTLVACTRCCRTWLPVAQANLYGDVFLSAATIPRFVGRASSEAMAKTNSTVYSLTVSVSMPAGYASKYRDAGTNAREVSREVPERLWDALAVLAAQVRDMSNLRSLSISGRRDSRTPRGWLSEIIDSLPASCVALEIDTMAEQDGDKGWDEAMGHVCPHIRNVLPRLRSLRLHLRTLCPEICGFRHDGAFKPVAVPHLEHCVINTMFSVFAAGFRGTRSCGDPSASAVVPLVNHLRALVTTPGHAPRLSQLWVLDTHVRLVLGPKPEDDKKHRAFVRHDVCANASVAAPFRLCCLNIPHPFLIKLPPRTLVARHGDGGEDDGDGDGDGNENWPCWISWPLKLQYLAEGWPWRETRGGVRLAALDGRLRRYEVQALALSPEEFKAFYPPGSGLLFEPGNRMKMSGTAIVALLDEPNVRLDDPNPPPSPELPERVHPSGSMGGSTNDS